MNKYLNYFLCFMMMLNLISCTSTKNYSGHYPSDAIENPVTEVNNDYFLQIGDIIEVKFFYNHELNERLIIRPDGKISLQLIDEVQAAGLTPSELDRVLTDKYSQRLQKAELVVMVKEFQRQRVYIGGEVNSPGLLPISGKITSLQAILQAGGFKDTAELKNIIIIRKQQGRDQPLFMTVNIFEDLRSRGKNNDIQLKPYDIVFVPKTTIAKMNQFVDQYIDKLIPISMNVGFTWLYDLNP